MIRTTFTTALAVAAVLLSSASIAADTTTKAATMADVLAASKDSDWRTPDPDNVVYLDLPNGRVVIELAPAFAPLHVTNIRNLIRQKYFDGLAILRVQDGFVTQWGDPDAGEPKARPMGDAKKTLPPEFTRPSADLPFTVLRDGDVYAPQVGHSNGFPAARDPESGKAWMAHCYGVLGVGRDTAPESGSGAELYVVIGQAPRQLDRNIATVGRVLRGMEWLTEFPRGTGPLGFYEQPGQRTPIKSVRLAADVPAAQRVALQVMKTDTTTFAALIESRRNRRDDWYHVPAGKIDLCNVPIPVRDTPAPGAEIITEKAAQLDAQYEDYWEEYLKMSPVTATYIGDERYNDQLVDSDSPENRARTHEFNQRWLDRVSAIGDNGLSGQALLSYKIFLRDRSDALAGEQFPDWMQPINQMYTSASMVVLLGSGAQAQPFKTVQDYENWIARASRVPVVFDTEIANMRAGIADGVVRPRVLMAKVVPQLDAIIKNKPEETAFWGPVNKMPADFSVADKERLTEAFHSLIGERLMPAYRKLRDFIRDEYLPESRASVGIDKLPNGVAWYAYSARVGTTTDLTPAEIHQIGLDEVARIHGEIQKVMKQVGYEGSMTKFFAFMQKDNRFEFKNEEALLADYRKLEAIIESHIPEQFSLVPKAKFEIRAVEAFRAESAAGGEYQSPSADGSRPGIFYVNTFDLPTRKTWDVEDLFLHEAIPGHHFQLALQQELTKLPKFRRFGGNNAFIEGWALYAESLGKDLGVYKDPYSYFGRLQGELWRAVRLVVDTGLHSKSWTRQQVIDYMHANSSVSTPDAIAEAERYMAWPGQALGYKIGELTIKRLRAKAETELGNGFDIREFHAEVIKDGALPLGILEDKINRWIASKKG